MYKLTVVNGAARGTVFRLEDGVRTVGRTLGNDVVLPSPQVSKKHCVLNVQGSDVTVSDAGSSNGTFVNGVLVKSRKLMPGDRLSVGDFVLELTKVVQPSTVPVILDSGDFGNVVPIRGVPAGGLGGFGGAPQPGTVVPGLTAGLEQVNAQSATGAAPKNIKEKVQFYFEKFVLNFLQNLNEKYEWRAMVAVMFAILTVGAAVLSVYPVLDRATEKLATEARERAAFLARQVVDRNSPFIYEKLDSKVSVELVEKEKGVLAAYVTDNEGRILAPARKLNQYLTDANEASFGAIARAAFAKDESRGQLSRVYGDAVYVAVPLRIFSQAAGKNVTVALGIVGFDRSLMLFDEGTAALTYIQALILASILSVIVFFSVYRLTLKPLTKLNEDIDLVLKGNASAVSRKFKMEEVDPLFDVINVALQRASGFQGSASAVGAGGDMPSIDEVIGALKFMAESAAGSGVLLLSPEKRVLHLNAFMEEITGIRTAMAAGDEFANVVRDAAFNALVDEMVSKTTPGAAAIAEDFEFSGTMYRMECYGIGQPGAAKLYVMTARKSG